MWQPDHGASTYFAKTGDTLGAEALVVGYECDGCEFSFDKADQHPRSRAIRPMDSRYRDRSCASWETHEAPDNLADNYVGELNWVAERIGGEDTPENRNRYTEGHAVLGSFKRGKGEVFTTGCTDWAYGLGNDTVATITNNVLNHFIRTSRKS
ncbi:MAG: hypothetical protein Ct9H300mP8_12950 [Gammaproteobacteria bacterium]|nr:MAG: hypothetical protein Ct9H300mP8_12950 [Gammaproteobacteria bacterium]